MDEIDFAIEGAQEYAVKSDSSPFDKVLPEEPEKLSTKSKRIPFQTKAGTTQLISLKEKNKYHEAIFRGCAAGFQTDWFSRLSDVSKPRYFESARKLFDWINGSGYNTTDETRYSVLKDYEAYQRNDLGLKGGGLGSIVTTLNEGLGCLSLTSEDHEYLQILLSLSKPAQRLESQPVTLSSWFDLPWLRTIIGDQAYLQLESPSLLFKSFRVTIATTLQWLLEKRRRWMKSSAIHFDTSYKTWCYDWNRLLLQHIGKFNDEGEPEDELSQLLLLDLVLPFAQSAVKEKIAKSGTKDLPRTIVINNKKTPPWQKPVFFHPDYQTQYSAIEELLCAYLVACEAVQPTDIQKLKTKNYAREYNRYGRLVAMQCTYYKGRAGTIKQPAMLMNSDPWTKALDSYMSGLSEPALFKTHVAAQNKFPVLKYTHNSMSSFFKIWKLSDFQKQLKSELIGAEATSLFTRVMLALDQGQENYTQFYKRTKKGVDEYQVLSSQPLPASIFTLTHIKTTAVHAETDIYREADLINHHSHTALTERTSYLTDANKEWVNQAGRITRLVLHDLQNVVFQPPVTAISQAVNDLKLRTKIIKATRAKDAMTHSLRSNPVETDNENTFIVSDTTDTALYFIHYITQAEAMLPRLLSVRPDWVERTLIVQIEWMTCTLARMQATATAQKIYVKLAKHLPLLFNHLLETME
ncbi:MAG: hypothetical protein RPS99_07335 [Gammaproteobacteria bacterium]